MFCMNTDFTKSIIGQEIALYSKCIALIKILQRDAIFAGFCLHIQTWEF